jgi:hypothetical protein
MGRATPPPMLTPKFVMSQILDPLMDLCKSPLCRYLAVDPRSAGPRGARGEISLGALSRAEIYAPLAGCRRSLSFGFWNGFVSSVVAEFAFD